MDLVFFGSGAFGLPTLKALVAAHHVRAVITQPDRPAGRGKKLTPTLIGAWAEERGLDVLKPPNVNEPTVVERVRGIPADAWVVIAFGQKLSRVLLDGVFAVNLHASLLPRWRGAAPINAAIVGGDEVTGNSVITLADRMDAGLVLGQSRREIEPSQTAGDLHDLLSEDGPALVLDVLAAYEAGRLEPVEQDESLVTIAPKLSSRDRWVDFGQPAEASARRIHGLTPWPGVSVGIDGLQAKVSRVEVVEGGCQSGEVGVLIDAPGGIVSCGGGTRLRLIEVQPAGKRPMGWSDFVRGHEVRSGQRVDGGSGG